MAKMIKDNGALFGKDFARLYGSINNKPINDIIAKVVKD
jgi:hypothetical protein